MKVSYNKLWKLLIDLKLTRTDLRRASGISTYSLAKLGKEEEVTMTTLRKLCKALDCEIEDIVDFLPQRSHSHRDLAGPKGIINVDDGKSL